MPPAKTKTSPIITITLTVVLLLMLQACNTSINDNLINVTKTVSTKPYLIDKTWYQPTLKTNGFKQKGVASWYGEKFHGRRTSSGEIYNMHAMTAAHKTLPLGCWVRVLNLNNNKQVDVKITDRGPFIKNRIIDLSHAAAKKIDMINQGTAIVIIAYLGEKKITKDGSMYTKPTYKSGPLAIQVGAFRSIQGAKKLKRHLKKKQYQAKIIPSQHKGTTLYRVRISEFKTLEDATQHKELLRKNGFTDSTILTLTKTNNNLTEETDRYQ